MKNIAVIPARSGSKGLKDKNIRPLGGRPLLAYSIAAAKESHMFEEIMVSTDSRKYAEIAKSCGASVPFLRSEKCSGDQAGNWDVIKEVLEGYQSVGRLFDTVCYLQPTSPLREPQDIQNGYSLLDEKRADAVTAVCETEHPPLWTMLLPEDRSLTEFRKKLPALRRQDMPVYYRLNGALYIWRIHYSDKGIELLSRSEYAYVMERRKSVDIDSLEDFEYAEFLIRGGFLNT